MRIPGALVKIFEFRKRLIFHSNMSLNTTVYQAMVRNVAFVSSCSSFLLPYPTVSSELELGGPLNILRPMVSRPVYVQEASCPQPLGEKVQYSNCPAALQTGHGTWGCYVFKRQPVPLPTTPASLSFTVGKLESGKAKMPPGTLLSRGHLLPCCMGYPFLVL